MRQSGVGRREGRIQRERHRGGGGSDEGRRGGGGGGEGEDDSESQPLLLLASHPRSYYIIPPHIARPLVVSSHMLLLQAIGALVVCARGAPFIVYGLPLLLFGTYITSVNFWKSPSTHTLWRYADYGMVASSILYGTFVTKTAAPAALHTLWCHGWSVVAALFVANETRFWCKTAKSRRDYVLAVWVHVGAVHFGGNVLVACALVALGGYGPWMHM